MSNTSSIFEWIRKWFGLPRVSAYGEPLIMCDMLERRDDPERMIEDALIAAETEQLPSIWHVYPVADLIEHETTGQDCVCVPRCQPVKREDGSVGWVLVHHSLDGRELSAK